MKQIITTFLGLILLLCAKAQTVQLLTNNAHEFGFVDATKTHFYTYNDISNTNPNAAANFELKKFDPVANTFSVVFTMPNNQQYFKFYPVAILNGKCLFIGKHYDTIKTARNYFVYDGFTLDSILPQPGYDNKYLNVYVDVLKTKVYFANSNFSYNTDIYVSDFTKIGTKKKFSLNDPIYKNHGLFGIDSTVYFIANNSAQILKLQDSTVSVIDTLGYRFAFFNYAFKDDVKNELYIYKGQGNGINNNNRLFKINALGQKIFLPNFPSGTVLGSGYNLYGRVNNKLVFIDFPVAGLITYDLLTGQLDTLYKANAMLEPHLNPPFEVSSAYFTKSYNHMYLYIYNAVGLSKMWVTDGLSVQELNAVPAYNSSNLFVPSTSEYNYNTSFCNENWLCNYYNGANSTKMIMFDPNANGSLTCFQSSDPNLNCLFSSAHQVNNTTYILSKSNLYEITNCSISTDLSNPNASNAFSLFPNPSTDKISIGDYVFESVEVYNQLGIIVHRAKHASSFSTSALAPGIYSAKMKIGNAAVIRQFVKE